MSVNTCVPLFRSLMSPNLSRHYRCGGVYRVVGTEDFNSTHRLKRSLTVYVALHYFPANGYVIELRRDVLIGGSINIYALDWHPGERPRSAMRAKNQPPSSYLPSALITIRRDWSTLRDVPLEAE